MHLENINFIVEIIMMILELEGNTVGRSPMKIHRFQDKGVPDIPLFRC